jgi:hypothetical protein
MTQFTWRDVAAPDFSGAAKGFTDAGRLLSDTIGKGVDGVQAFDKSQSDLAAQKLALYVAQNQDPTALQAGFNVGSLGGMDLTERRMRAAALDQLNPGKINGMIDDQQKRADAKLSHDRKANFQAMTPQLADVMQGLNSTDPVMREAAKIRANQIDWSGTDYTDMADFVAKVPGLEKASYAFGNEKQDRIDADSATKAGQLIRSMSLNADDARMHLNDPQGAAAGLSVRARAKLENELGGQYPGLFGSDAGGTGAGAAIAGALGGGAPVSGGYDRIVGDVVQPPKPPSTMTIAELEDYGNKVVIPATKSMDPGKRSQLGLSATRGSSAMGKYQIIGDTAISYARKLGWDPNTTVFDAAHQEALAEAIFNDAKKGDLTDVFASVPRKAPGAYKDVTWDQMRTQIARGESGPSTAQLVSTSRNALYEVGSRSMQDSAHGLDIDFGATLSDTSSPTAIADQLVGKDGTFRGTDRGFMLDQINKIMREGKVNAATAGAVLSRNMQGADHPIMSVRDFAKRLMPGGTPNLGGGVRLNDSGVAADIKILSKLDKGALLSQIAARGARNDLTGQIQAATASLAAAQQAYTQAATRAITQPALRASLPRYEADLAARKQALMMLQAQTQMASNQPQ